MSTMVFLLLAVVPSEGQALQNASQAAPSQMICKSLKPEATFKADRNIVCATKQEWAQYKAWVRKQERDDFPISGRQ